MANKKQELAVFVAARLDGSAKTQTEIASEIGFEHSNFLSMIRTGKARIPLARMLALADALEVPRDDLVRRCLDAYEPELYAIILAVFPGLSISDEEMDTIRTIRAARSLPASARRAFAGKAATTGVPKAPTKNEEDR